MNRTFRLVRRSCDDVLDLGHERFVEPVRDPVVAGEVERQPVEGQAGEREATRGLEPQPQRRSGTVDARQAQRGKGGSGDVARLGHAERPEGDRVRGREGAAGLLAGSELADQAGSARDGKTVLQWCRVRVGLEADDRRRGGGCEEIGVDHLQQVVGEALVLGVELQVHARGEEREAVEQPFDVGVGAAVGAQAEPVGDARVVRGELAGEIAHEAQLLLVVAQESPVHQATASAPSTRALPSSRSSSVRTRRVSASG